MHPYYYSLNEYLQDTYGEKIYKLALNGGMSCPNRDGQLDTRGCIFCSAGGSGEFTGASVLKRQSLLSDSTCGSEPTSQSPLRCPDINHQIEAGKELLSSKFKQTSYIAYFQSYTNTYADINYLESLFLPVINRPDIRILSIATRPDCLGPEVIDLLNRLNKIKPVWIELGLQTIHEASATYIRRGYPLSVFEDAVARLNSIGINPIVHMIIGLPDESKQQILETADYIGQCGASGIKLQLLHILKGTDLARDYHAGFFEAMDMPTYLSCLGEILELLPADMVIHRLTGDGPKQLLIEPAWSSNKKHVLNAINQYFKDNNIHQGRKYK